MQLCSKRILNDQKNILSNKIHQLRIERCRLKAEPKTKNAIKLADIHRGDESIFTREALNSTCMLLSQDRVLG